MIVVTGATGKLGSRIVEALLERASAPEGLAVSVRDPGNAQDLAARGIRVRAGDFTDPASLRHAFDGADTVVVVSAAVRDHEAAVAANRSAIDAAVGAGASRVIYTSHQAASPTSQFAPQRVHAATEEYLAQTGVAFTALRNGFYASTLAMYLGEVRESASITAPQDGPVSWTGHQDLAEAAALSALGGSGVLDGVTAPLTAGAVLDFADVADIAAEIIGRPVTRTVVADGDWVTMMAERGMPRDSAEFMLGMFRAARAGEFTVTDPTLHTVIGHPPAPAREVIERTLSS